jgi:hypothetical protein
MHLRQRNNSSSGTTPTSQPSSRRSNQAAEIINSLQPINTSISSSSHHQRNYSHQQPQGQQGKQPYYAESHSQRGWASATEQLQQQQHVPWSPRDFNISALNSPTNYSEIFQQLSAPTPMISSAVNSAHAPHQHSHPNHSSNNNDSLTTAFGGGLNSLGAHSHENDDLLTHYSNFSGNDLNTVGDLSGLVEGGPNSGGKGKKVSDALTYGPRFCEIFNCYCRDLKLHINTQKHLMTLCSENLVSFICWARETEDRVKWMWKLLYENDYLRPEVRNGIVIVIIYTFAAIKASHHGGDMFITLQDTEDGLGIANRFSLKIYNDPYGYLSFLKFSISSLIDAGAIPENERLNKPGKKGTSKPLPKNYEEVEAYNRLVRKLSEYLEHNNHTEARALVQVVTTHWQFRGNVSLPSLVILLFHCFFVSSFISSSV